MDQVHKETDEKLKEIEEKVKSVYDTAQKEAKEKLDTYLKQFADEDKEKQADVQAGDMTWTQYKKWRQDKILTGNRYRAMSEQLTSDYVNADKIAMSIVNGFTPEVYAMNYNYGTYEAESGSMVDTSFTLYDRQTVERLIRDDPDLLPKANVDIPKDKRWNRQKLNSAITQGVLQGDSIPDISKRLQSVTDMDRRAAIRNARTMTTSAENGGRQDSYTRAESMGIKMKKQWMATLDSTTRDSHVMADGQVVGTKDTFHLMHGELEYPGDPAGPPSEVYNCFLGSTIAYANNEILRSYKHWYDGDLIEIKTARGVSFSVTPNHPILSIDGWVHANALHEGDNILVADFSGDSVSRYPDINYIPSRMDALHKFFDKFGSKRTCSLGVNFHGDVPTSDVEIVTKKWFLRNSRNSGRSKSIDKFLLKFANKSCMSKSPVVKHLWSIAFSTLGNVRSMSKMLSFIFGSMCHTVVHSGRTIPDRDIVISQNSIDNLSAEAVLSGKGLDGLSGKVSTDKIVSVKIYSFHGYVYNLQTKDNYYCVNSIISDNGKYAIAHNCRCTMTAIVDGVDEKLNYQSGSYTNTKLGEVTYDEWKDMHSHKQTSTQKTEQKTEEKEVKDTFGHTLEKSFKVYSQDGLDGHDIRVTKETHIFSDGAGKDNKDFERDATVYRLDDGTKFIFPADIDKSKQSATPDLFIKLWYRIPEEYRKQIQKTVEIVDYRNPQDLYWEREYGMENFRSYATGGNKITFYANTDHNPQYVVSTYAHEGGHYIDRAKADPGERICESKEWARAVKNDVKQTGYDYPTDYARQTATNKPGYYVEDFAESCAKFVTQYDIFKAHFPNRASILEGILNGAHQ